MPCGLQISFMPVVIVHGTHHSVLRSPYENGHRNGKVDIIAALIQQPDYQAARNYWKVLKNRLKKEGSESVTKCNQLKLPSADGKKYLSAGTLINKA